MSAYRIVTDSACDLAPEILRDWQVDMVAMPYMFQDTGELHVDHDMPISAFYAQMRGGRVAKTSAVNVDAYDDLFKPLLEQGLDILYVAFSSGLSATCANGKTAAAALEQHYPGRTIRVVDSLCASAGEGLFLYFAKENRDRGMSLEENADALEADKLHLCHWFTVDDLKYLKRGGRISPATALLGTALNVKPVLHVDNDGHLIKVAQVHGRKKAIRTMAEHLGKSVLKGSPVYISHGDCLGDAEYLARIVREEYGYETQIITYVGALIGAHSGPGTLALFFRGTER